MREPMHRRLSILTLAVVAIAVPLAARADEAAGSFERTLSVTGPVDLSVQTRSGHIMVRAGEPGKVTIHGEIKLRRNFLGFRVGRDQLQELEENPPIRQSGNTIRIEKVPDNGVWRRLSLSYEITVPKTARVDADTGSGRILVQGVEGPVSADTGSGSIEMADIGAEVVADTGSGSIEVENIKGGAELNTGSGSIRATDVAGRLSADTGSGSIRAELIDAGPVELETGSGSIRVSGVQGSLRATTGSGSIRAEGNPSDDWLLRSSSGSVTVRLPGHTGFDLYARTGSGRITTDLPITVQGKLTRHELRGRVGDGGPGVELRTGSGNIRIEEMLAAQ